MRAILLVIAGLSLAACGSAGVPAAASAHPELYDATPDGGRIAYAGGQYSDEAAEIAAAHCLETGRDVRIVGLIAERESLVFTCIAV
jgi:hypothetical protein